jgi:transposase-like protein
MSKKPLKVGNMTIPHSPNATWKPEKKIQVVSQWLVLGNLRQVAAIAGVSYGIVRNWKSQPWWKELENEILASRRIASSNKLSKIVDKSLDVIDDRLDKGDFIYTKTGLQRKPVSLRDATTAANALMQRAAVLDQINRDEKIEEHTATITEQLANLALEFAKFNKRTNGAAQTIAYKESDSALYDQRETRLQEGSGEVYLETFSSQKENGAECSPS